MAVDNEFDFPQVTNLHTTKLKSKVILYANFPLRKKKYEKTNF